MVATGSYLFSLMWNDANGEWRLRRRNIFFAARRQMVRRFISWVSDDDRHLNYAASTKCDLFFILPLLLPWWAYYVRLCCRQSAAGGVTWWHRETPVADRRAARVHGHVAPVHPHVPHHAPLSSLTPLRHQRLRQRHRSRSRCVHTLPIMHQCLDNVQVDHVQCLLSFNLWLDYWF